MSYPPPPGGPGGAYPQGQGGWAPQQGGAPSPYQPQGAPGPGPGPGQFGAPPPPPGTAQGWPGVPGAPYPQQPFPGGGSGGVGGGGGGQGKGLKKAVIGVVVVAVLAVLGVGGLAVYRAVGGGALPTAGGGSQSEQLLGAEEIEELLEGRSQALKSGDEDAYLEPFSGKARETQKKLFNNLRKIPFARAEYSVLSQSGSGDDNYGTGATVSLDVAFVHQIQNVDVRPVSEWYHWVIKRESKSSEPRITKVGPSGNAYGSSSYVYYPAPWDLYEDMHVVRQEHSITVSDKKHAADTDRFAPYIEKAAQDDISLWKSSGPAETEVPSGFFTVLEPDRKTYSTLYSSDAEEWEAGQSLPMPTFDAEFSGTEKDLEYGGARIKMDSSGNHFTHATRWQLGVEGLAHHEFAHALVQPLEAAYGGFGSDGASTEWWVVEGFAEYMELRFDSERASWSIQGIKEFDGSLPGGPGVLESEVSSQYALGYTAVRFIAEKGGEKAALQFVADHYRKPGELDQQLQEATGMGEGEFEAAWAGYVRSIS